MSGDATNGQLSPAGPKSIDLTIDDSDVIAGAKIVLNTIRPKWKLADIKFKVYKGSSIKL